MARDGSESPSPRKRSGSGSPKKGGSRSPTPAAKRGGSRSPTPAKRGSRRSRSRSRGGKKNGGRKDDDYDYGNSGVIVQVKGSGFGFIKPDVANDDDHNLYFHVSGCGKGQTFDSLRPRDKVTYEVGTDDRRNQLVAKNVKFAVKGGDRGRNRDDSRDRGDRGRSRRSRSRRDSRDRGRSRRDSRSRNRRR
mmetsp:Transcript_84110/g.132800  ORF Transcript_84110/g.132800 Transcript_84110/m.132800 type:complete len:191 (-) Transcript_84110:77-649(-)